MPLNDRSEVLSRLANSTSSRAAYIGAKLGVLIPAQIRGMRFNRHLKQSQLAHESGMLQSRISAVETPGASLNVETLVRLAAALKVGLVVKFVPFSEMLGWENGFKQDTFDPVQIDQDIAFLSPSQTWPAHASLYFGLTGPKPDQFITTTAPAPGQHPMLKGQIASHYEQNPPIAAIAERT
jgi:transcriptional regulator with XRE-family HTH domain